MRPPGWNLRTELVALVLLQASAWFAMLGPHRDWLWSWRAAVDWAAGSVIIAGPVLAGIVATQQVGWQQSSLAELGAGSVRPLRSWFAVPLRLWALSLVSLALVAAAVTLRAVVVGQPVAARHLAILAPAGVVLSAHVLIGVAIGRRIGARTAPVLAAAASFGMFLLATRDLAPPSFVTGGATGSLVGEQYRWSSVFVLAVLAGLSAVVLWPLACPPGQWPGAPALGLAAVAGILVVGNVAWPDIEDRLEPAAVDLECRGTRPTTCVAEDSRQVLDEVSRRLSELAGPLVALGVDLPMRWVEKLPGARGQVTHGALDLGDLATAPNDRPLIRSLTMPADCPAYALGLDPAESLEARSRLASWIAFRNGLGRTEEAAAWFSSDDAEEWVKRTYSSLRTCDLDAVRQP